MNRGRSPMVMIVVLLAVMLVGGVALSSKSSTSSKKKAQPAQQAQSAKQAPKAAQSQQQQQQPTGFTAAAKGGRIAVVQTDGGSRTVVVPACDTPVNATVASATNDTYAPGATVLELPRARTTRTVIVPACTGSSGQAQRPSAAIVMAGVLQSPVGAKTQLTVDRSTHARTIVLPPCPASKSGPSGGTAAASSATKAVGGRLLVASPC